MDPFGQHERNQMTTTFQEANAALRQAVGTRIAAVAAGRATEQWYDPQDEDSPKPLIGDSLLASSDVHPVSQRFFDLCDGLKQMHQGKSRDYGCPSGTDPLANIRNGAKFVGIPSWKAAMVRLSDKVTRLATFNATGTLHNEGVIDTLEDLASYAILARLLYEEERGG
jgi:hypothetical protein